MKKLIHINRLPRTYTHAHTHANTRTHTHTHKTVVMWDNLFVTPGHDVMQRLRATDVITTPYVTVLLRVTNDDAYLYVIG